MQQGYAPIRGAREEFYLTRFYGRVQVCVRACVAVAVHALPLLPHAQLAWGGAAQEKSSGGQAAPPCCAATLGLVYTQDALEALPAAATRWCCGGAWL